MKSRFIHQAALVAALFFVVREVSAQTRQQGPQVTSPEVLSERKITFRVLAPKAEAVKLGGSGDIPGTGFGQSTPLTQGTNGVWEITVGPLPPGSYRYNFDVDGVAVIDPRNPKTSESNENT